MRTTLDLPDPLFRQLKSRAALEGVSLKDLMARLLTAGMRSADASADRVSEGPAPAVVAPRQPFVSALDVLRDGVGSAPSGRGDLSTNRAHLDGFGRE